MNVATTAHLKEKVEMVEKVKPAQVADAIERGRAAFPRLKVARGQLAFIEKPIGVGYVGENEALIELKAGGEQRVKVTAACAIGFAVLGCMTGQEDFSLYESTCPVKSCPNHGAGYTSIPHLNDDHKWSPERIVKFLRTLS